MLGVAQSCVWRGSCTRGSLLCDNILAPAGVPAAPAGLLTGVETVCGQPERETPWPMPLTQHLAGFRTVILRLKPWSLRCWRDLGFASSCQLEFPVGGRRELAVLSLLRRDANATPSVRLARQKRGRERTSSRNAAGARLGGGLHVADSRSSPSSDVILSVSAGMSDGHPSEAVGQSGIWGHWAMAPCP